ATWQGSLLSSRAVRLGDSVDPRSAHGPLESPSHGRHASRQSSLVDVASHAGTFAEEAGRRPCLAAVLVGEDPASVTYVKMKQSRSRKAGIDSRLVRLPESASTAELV